MLAEANKKARKSSNIKNMNHIFKEAPLDRQANFKHTISELPIKPELV